MRHILLLITVLLLAACTKVTPETPDAVITNATGDVSIDDQPAFAGKTLLTGARIVTGANGEATITFLKGSVLRLEPNSTITILELSNQTIHINQSNGRSWNRITRFGKPADYTLETPYAVATVRGTAFGVDVDEDHAEIKVTHGSVATETEDGENETVDAGEQLDADEDGAVVEALEEDTWIDEQEDADEEFIEELAEEYIEEHQDEYADAGEESGATPEQLEDWVEQWGEGDVDEPVPEDAEDIEHLEELEAEEDLDEAEDAIEDAVDDGAIGDANDDDAIEHDDADDAEPEETDAHETDDAVSTADDPTVQEAPDAADHVDEPADAPTADDAVSAPHAPGAIGSADAAGMTFDAMVCGRTIGF